MVLPSFSILPSPLLFYLHSSLFHIGSCLLVSPLWLVLVYFLFQRCLSIFLLWLYPGILPLLPFHIILWFGLYLYL